MRVGDLSTLSPEYVRRIAPYVPGKPVEELAREYGLAEKDIVKLASNENPRGPSPRVRQASPTRWRASRDTRTGTGLR